MQQTFLAQVVLPVVLALVMLGMGLSLVVDDFRRVLKTPKAAAVGIFCQMLLLPIIALGVVKVLGLDPVLAVGLMVLAFCPGGTTSNMLTYLARGDVALSVSLTAVVSVVTPFTIPILAAASMNHLMGADQAIAVPLGQTIGVLFGITLVPIAIGMGVKAKWPSVADRADKPVKWFSVIALFAIIGGLIKQNAAELPTFFAQAGTATLLLNAGAMALGVLAARLSRLDRKQQITIGMEVGIQNGTTALMVTGTLLGNATMTIAPAIYSLIMYGTGAVFGVLLNLGRRDEEIVPSPKAA
jgi:bile acid:Na+ symporter, BASS family